MLKRIVCVVLFAVLLLSLFPGCSSEIIPQTEIRAAVLYSEGENWKDTHAPANAEQPGLQTVSDHQPQSKSNHQIRKQLLSPAHNNTPCTLYAGGDLF